MQEISDGDRKQTEGVEVERRGGKKRKGNEATN